jgi:hypothetical protein
VGASPTGASDIDSVVAADCSAGERCAAPQANAIIVRAPHAAPRIVATLLSDTIVAMGIALPRRLIGQLSIPLAARESNRPSRRRRKNPSESARACIGFSANGFEIAVS